MVMALRARARGNHLAKQQNRSASSPSKTGGQTRRKTPNVRSQKCVSSRQAWTKRILHTKTARFFQHLVEGRVIAGDAKMQRYRQSRQSPTRRGRRQTAAPSTMGEQKHGAANCVHCPPTNQNQTERNKTNETHKNPNQRKALRIGRSNSRNRKAQGQEDLP